jgi:TIR domain
MANIFLSYAREDVERARLLAERLESHGWSVWWDRRIPFGQDFTTYLQQQLDEAGCILVLWSKASVASTFVRDEAKEGLNGRLVPLLLDSVKQPLGFRELQAANLVDWTGDASDHEFLRLLKSIGAIVAPRAAPATANQRTAWRSTTGQFEFDAYISYSRLDDLPLVEANKGWVSTFVWALEKRLSQLLGREIRIWFLSELQNNDALLDAALDRLGRAAVMVAIVSPRYVKSEWTTRELQEFWKTAQRRGDLRDQDRSPIFKVVKTPVPLDRQPPPLPSLLGYEFFKVDPMTGRIRELDQAFGEEARMNFLIKLDDLATDIAAVLESCDGATT